MPDSLGGLVLLVFLVSMLGALAVVVGYNRIRQSLAGRVPSAGRRPAAPTGLPERQASVATEQLQAIIQREMASDPSLGARTIDFGTAPDGSLEIWLGEDRYAEVEEIPDARLRELIARAIEEFNREAPGA